MPGDHGTSVPGDHGTIPTHINTIATHTNLYLTFAATLEHLKSFWWVVVVVVDFLIIVSTPGPYLTRNQADYTRKDHGQFITSPGQGPGPGARQNLICIGLNILV